jgi:hypothetical protein
VLVIGAAQTTEPLAFRPHPCVGLAIQMALVAMGTSSVSCASTFAAQDILALGDRLKVIRANALTISAEMVELQPFWDRTDQDLIDDTMGVGLATIDSHLAVARSSDMGYPIPAAIAE